jgi:3-dehydroquinate dehydratase type I
MKNGFGKTPLIVGCVGSEALLRKCSKKMPVVCDMLEVRLDLTGLCGGEWTQLCAAIQKQGMPVLLTIRDENEGGAWKGREAERLALYLAGIKSVSAVDVELGARALELLAQTAHRRGVRVVGSFHDFSGTPDLAKLNAVEARGRRLGVDVVKIATLVNTSADLARLFALPANAKGPICVMGMGKLGSVSRVALPCAGSCLVYGSLGKATAPGQLSCRDLAKELRRWGARQG